jgi:hypothetical protein
MEFLVINTRDKLTFEIPIKDFDNMEEFYLKNMLEDTTDSDPLFINEDYNIIKNIIDSMRYKKLIFDKDTNLRLMYKLSEKWCCPVWLQDYIEEELYTSPKLKQLNYFVESLTNNIYKCTNCGIGFNKYNNKPNSCKTHKACNTMSETNRYACCNKEEPCMVGYHVIDKIELCIHVIKPLIEKDF